MSWFYEARGGGDIWQKLYDISLKIYNWTYIVMTAIKSIKEFIMRGFPWIIFIVGNLLCEKSYTKRANLSKFCSFQL